VFYVIAYRDKKVVGVFVRFSCTLQQEYEKSLMIVVRESGKVLVVRSERPVDEDHITLIRATSRMMKDRKCGSNLV
jgi:hypothetical protein